MYNRILVYIFFLIIFSIKFWILANLSYSRRTELFFRIIMVVVVVACVAFSHQFSIPKTQLTITITMQQWHFLSSRYCVMYECRSNSGTRMSWLNLSWFTKMFETELISEQLIKSESDHVVGILLPTQWSIHWIKSSRQFSGNFHRIRVSVCMLCAHSICFLFGVTEYPMLRCFICLEFIAFYWK